MGKGQIMTEEQIDRTLKRIAHEIIEKNNDLTDIIIVGIQTRGEFLGERLQSKIMDILSIHIPLETLNITFYRDDLEVIEGLDEPLTGEITIQHDLTNKTVILVDDVLYTGRTVRAAMDAILSNYRPSAIQLAILIDRGHRELPIRADFVGKNVPSSKSEQIKVMLKEIDGEDSVQIIKKEE